MDRLVPDSCNSDFFGISKIHGTLIRLGTSGICTCRKDMHTVLWLLKVRVKKVFWFFWELVKRNEKDGSESNSKIPAEAFSERDG